MKNERPLRPSPTPTHVKLCIRSFRMLEIDVINRTEKVSALMKLLVYHLHSQSDHKQISHIIVYEIVNKCCEGKQI